MAFYFVLKEKNETTLLFKNFLKNQNSQKMIYFHSDTLECVFFNDLHACSLVLNQLMALCNI